MCRISKQVMTLELHSNIDKLILNNGLRRKFIADQLGISTAQLKNISTGRSWADAYKMYLLADILNCEVTDLYTKKP